MSPHKICNNFNTSLTLLSSFFNQTTEVFQTPAEEEADLNPADSSKHVDEPEVSPKAVAATPQPNQGTEDTSIAESPSKTDTSADVPMEDVAKKDAPTDDTDGDTVPSHLAVESGQGTDASHPELTFFEMCPNQQLLQFNIESMKKNELLPLPTSTEIKVDGCFVVAGGTNVGKSSLIKRLTGNDALVRLPITPRNCMLRQP